MSQVKYINIAKTMCAESGGLKMTLDEAIEERLKVIKVQEKLYEESYSDESKEIIKNATDNDRQLADWLTELKDLREENRCWKEEFANLNKIGYDFYKELKEARRLLKAAVEDMHIEDMCDVCAKRIPNSPIRCPDGSDCFVWRYKAEALKLIES